MYNPKTFLRCICTAAMSVALMTLMAGCIPGNPHRINGKNTGQPIMDGWTRQQAGEFWLAATLTDNWSDVINAKRGWMTAEELASLSNVNVKVTLPVHPENPMPKMGVTYRQKSTGGYITFRDSVIVGDTLHTIGVADYQLCEPLYFSFNEKGATSMVQNRGKGIFTLYHMNRVRNREDGTARYEPQWDAAVISVFPGADSLLICRGNTIYEAYTAE